MQNILPLSGRPAAPVSPPEQVARSPTFPFWTSSWTSVEPAERMPVPVIAKIPSAAAVVRSAEAATRMEVVVNCMLID